MIKEDTDLTPQPTDVLRVDHVGVMVRDIEEAVAWYTRTLGLAVTDRWEEPDLQMAWAHLQAGTTRLELVQRPGLRSAAPGISGLHHIALVVADCAATTELLAQAGGEVVRDPSYFDRHDMDWSFVRDPFGNILEIVSYRHSGHDHDHDHDHPEHQGGAFGR